MSQVGALLYLLKEVVGTDEQTIVFASTRHHVSFLGQLLQADGLQCSLVYGEMDQTARNISVAKFGARKSKVRASLSLHPSSSFQVANEQTVWMEMRLRRNLIFLNFHWFSHVYARRAAGQQERECRGDAAEPIMTGGGAWRRCCNGMGSHAGVDRDGRGGARHRHSPAGQRHQL